MLRMPKQYHIMANVTNTGSAPARMYTRRRPQRLRVRSVNSPITGSTMALPAAVTRAGGPSNSQQAMSKSWIIMSRNNPPETLI